MAKKNDYGNDTYVQPLHGYYNQKASPVSVNEIERKSNITHIDVYSTTGQYLKRINKTSELKDMSKRLFILKIYNDNGKTITVRRILKDGTNYIAIRDIANSMGYKVENKGNMAILNKV